MKTIKFEDVQTGNDEFRKCIALALDNDMRVFIYESQTDKPVCTYAFIESIKGLGYVQTSRSFHGVQFSTCHKACKEHGTGFGLDGSFDAVDATIEGINESFIKAPNWVKKDLDKIDKFKSFDDYLKRGVTMLKYMEVIK